MPIYTTLHVRKSLLGFLKSGNVCYLKYFTTYTYLYANIDSIFPNIITSITVKIELTKKN